MKIRALLYTTKAKPYLTRNDLPNEKGEFYKHWQLGGELDKKHLYGDTPILNGKIVAECDYEVEDIENTIITTVDASHCRLSTNKLTEEELFKHSCLSRYEMFDYLKHGFSKADEPRGKVIHIKNLHIFDKPKELKECHKKDGDFFVNYYVPIDRAPQNMMRVWLYENGEWVMYILISIQSQWMCKILNKEKTVEVRKVVLKEMLK